MGLRTVLNQVSDDDIKKFLTELESILGDTLDEMHQDTSADLDMKDHNAIRSKDTT